MELNNFTFLILIVVIFYFFILSPQLKRSRKEKKFLATMAKGDRIITKSGMHGKIAALNDKDLVLAKIKNKLDLLFNPLIKVA